MDGNVVPGLSADETSGRWKEAEELNMQAMEMRKRVLGQEHPDALTSMANLASTYQNQGRRKEAEQLEMQVMGTSARMVGVDRLNLLSSMDNLASMSAGRDEETVAQFETPEPSDIESIFSLASDSAISTKVSSLSLEEVLASASDQLVTLLINDTILHSLFLASVEAKTIGGERFARNFRRLLKIFARDLKIEAQEPVQNVAAHLVQSRVTYVTQSIRARYDPKYQEIYQGVHQIKRSQINQIKCLANKRKSPLKSNQMGIYRFAK